LRLVGKLKSRRAFIGSAAMPAYATAKAMHFPANAGLIFLTDDLTSDSYQFTSNFWAELCNRHNILHLQTTTYHPEANSAV
jgi:hypothetical protein